MTKPPTGYNPYTQKWDDDRRPTLAVVGEHLPAMTTTVPHVMRDMPPVPYVPRDAALMLSGEWHVVEQRPPLVVPTQPPPGLGTAAKRARRRQRRDR